MKAPVVSEAKAQTKPPADRRLSERVEHLPPPGAGGKPRADQVEWLDALALSVRASSTIVVHTYTSTPVTLQLREDEPVPTHEHPVRELDDFDEIASVLRSPGRPLATPASKWVYGHGRNRAA